MPMEAQTLTFTDAVAFEQWLKVNYKNQAGAWVKVAKVSSGIPSITNDELVDVGLCWGWISGQRKSYDKDYFLQKYVPRRKRSIWSQVNVEKVEMLVKGGRMQDPGIIEVDAAKADGRWDAAYAPQSNATPPLDLLDALAQNKIAQERYNQLTKSERYSVIMQLALTRDAKNRPAKIKKIINTLTTP